MVIKVKDHEHFDKIMEEAGAGLVVVDFFATWCGPCKAISPFIEGLSETYKDRVTFVKVDVDECEDIAQEYNISCMPTFLFLKNKAKIDEFSGANQTKLQEMVDKHAN